MQIFKEFCSHSSIHGLRYWVDPERHFFERVWWILAFIISVFCCMSLVYAMWQKWGDCPVIISFEHQPLAIANIPFPATTICPFIKTKCDIFNYTHVYRLLAQLEDNDQRAPNETELKYMQVAAQTCNEWFGSEMREHFDDDFTDNSILSTISQMAPSFDDIMVYCNLFNWVSDCSEIMFPIYTTEGLCFTFNSMNINDILTNEAASELKRLPSVQNRSKWDPDDGYIHEEDIDLDVFPYRALGMGKRERFQAVMKFSNRDIDYLCGGAFDGFKVTFHLPNELPSVRRKHYRISINKTTMILVSPNLILASPSIRNYAPALRQCYFTFERKLRFFHHYTQQNCELECLSNYTIHECGCVHFSLPIHGLMENNVFYVLDSSKLLGSQEAKVCGTRKVRCIMHAEKTLFLSGAENLCDCLPACTSVSYNIEQNLVEFDFINAWKKSRFPELIEFENSSFSRISLSFRIENLLPAKRIEFYSIGDFLSATGGLFGLFVGASVLSLIELIYFFTLRPCFSQQRNVTPDKTTRNYSCEVNKRNSSTF